MRNANDLLNAIKKTSTNATSQGKPTTITFGTVVSINPLSIYIEDKITLSESMLITMSNLTVKTGTLTIGDDDYSVTFDNSLKTGDKVVLMRMQGGQKYLILDKLVDL